MHDPGEYPANFEVFSPFDERKFSDWVEALCYTTNIMNLFLGMRPSYWNELKVKPESTYYDSDVKLIKYSTSSAICNM